MLNYTIYCAKEYHKIPFICKREKTYLEPEQSLSPELCSHFKIINRNDCETDTILIHKKEHATSASYRNRSRSVYFLNVSVTNRNY